MSNQVYSNQIPRPYAPNGVTDIYTLQAPGPFLIPLTTGPAWVGSSMGFNVCNGVNGVVTPLNPGPGNQTTFETGQYRSTQPKYFAKNISTQDNGGTVFYFLKDATWRINATICYNTPGLNNWRGIGIRITDPGNPPVVRPLIDANSVYTSGVPTEGFSMSSSAIVFIPGGAQMRIIALANDNTEELVADRGAVSQLLISEMSA